MPMRKFYSLREKRAILKVQRDESLTDSQAAQRYSIQPIQVAKWRERFPLMGGKKASAKTLHNGFRGKFWNHEEEILGYIIQRRSQKQGNLLFLIAVVSVRSVAAELARVSQIAGAQTFASLQKWVYRFLERRGLSIRRISRNVTLPNSELQSRLAVFLDDISAVMIQQPGLTFVNMDETAVQYEMIPKSTIEFVGADSVEVRGGNPTSRLTVALTVTSIGEKLPPFLIYKGSKQGRIFRETQEYAAEFGNELVFSLQKNAWMDTDLMKDWVERYVLL
jgi:transposase